MLATLPDNSTGVDTAQGTWGIYQVKGGMERRVAERLERAGHTAYLPLITVRRIVNRRARRIERPLYPAYIFAAFEDEHERAAIRHAEYVQGILNLRPREQHSLPRHITDLRTKAPEREVQTPEQELEEQIGTLARVLAVDPCVDSVTLDQFEADRMVRIVRGAYAGTVGRAETYTRKGRKGEESEITLVYVGIHTLGSYVSVEVNIRDVETID